MGGWVGWPQYSVLTYLSLNFTSYNCDQTLKTFSDQMQFENESKLQGIHDVSKDLFKKRETVSETTDMKFYTSGKIGVTAHQIILR